jgi:hypothetical protein
MEVTSLRQEASSVLHFQAADLTFEVFRDQCLKPNRPCVIHNLPEDVFPWRKLSRMLDPYAAETKQSPQEMRIRELIAVLAGTTAELAPIHQCRVSGPTTSAMKLAVDDVCQDRRLEEWIEGLDSKARYGSGRDPEVVSSSTDGIPDSTGAAGTLVTGVGSGLGTETWYLKDWHWQQTVESLRADGTPLYSVPTFLGEDWLNEFITWQRAQARHTPGDPNSGAAAASAGANVFGSGDDYRFVYIGEADGKTFTPFHFDVFGSYSWSVNVKGFKEWYFVPWWNDEWKRIFHDFPPHRERPLDIRCTQTTADSSASMRSIPFEVIIQEPGDLVFVPSCYFHQVHNVSMPSSKIGCGESIQDNFSPGAPCATAPNICISVNHNWCNEWNIELMLSLLSSDVERVIQLVDEEAVAALKRDGSWLETVEQILKSSGAWSLSAMDAMLEYKERQKVRENAGNPSAWTLEVIRTSRHRLQELKKLLV